MRQKGAIGNMQAKPFVKWAGGKGKLIKDLDSRLPADLDIREDITYIEPFVGGGAMLYHMLQNYKNIRRAIINDINPDLIRCYQLIKTAPDHLIDRLKNIENNYYKHDIIKRKELYYAYRDQYNQEGNNKNERAALFIFLNHTCFNGLYRVNASGKFNVPCGRYKHPIICNESVIHAAHELFNSIELIIKPAGDYKRIIKNLSSNGLNFVYFDPPYRPLINESNFKDYSNSPFGDKQQEELKEFCDLLGQRGCKIMLSNSDSKNEDGSSYFEELYEGYTFERIFAPRYINAFAERREKLSEVLIRNYND